MNPKIPAILTVLILLMVPAFSTRIDGNSTNSTNAWFNVLTIATSASIPNFWDKTQADGRYIQTELDPVWTTDKPNYYTGAALDILFTNTFTIFGQWLQGNTSIMNNTISSLGNWTADKGGYVTGAQLANNNSAQNDTINGKVSHQQMDGNISNFPYNETLLGYVNHAQLDGNLSTITVTPVIGLTTSSNVTYSVVEYNMEYTVATYERITTAPTRNTTCGVMTCLNFPSANTVGSDGGFIVGGNTATNGLNFNVTNMTYFGVKLRMPATAVRRDILGYFKTGTTLIQNTSFTGVAFKLNTTRGNNWNCSVADAGVGTWQDSGISPDTAWHFYEITQNSTHYNFFIDSVMRCSVSRANQPTTKLSSAGTWVESETTTVVVEVIDWLRHESWRSPN